MRSLHALALATALALSSAGAVAQAASETADSMAVPVWNSSNGKLEAVLWIDTSTLDDAKGATRTLGTRWTSRSGAFSSQLSTSIEPQMGLLCGSSGGRFAGLGDTCVVAQFGNSLAPRRQVSGQASVKIGRSEWTGFGSKLQGNTDGLLPGTSVALHMPELLPLAGSQRVAFEENDLGIVGELKLGQQGWVRVGANVARARLMPANSILPGSVVPRWSSRTLSVGGGYGALGGEVVGRVVNVPGEPEGYGTLGLGLTWRTPWAGRLTVGAQNLLSTGDNPLTPREGAEVREEGRVPYVRYQQDL